MGRMWLRMVIVGHAASPISRRTSCSNLVMTLLQCTAPSHSSPEQESAATGLPLYVVSASRGGCPQVRTNRSPRRSAHNGAREPSWLALPRHGTRCHPRRIPPRRDGSTAAPSIGSRAVQMPQSASHRRSTCPARPGSAVG